jgi:hypothetical protein
LNTAYKQGFISASRHTIIQEITNATTLGIWTKLKAAANYGLTSARMNREILILHRGAVVFSIKQMAESLQMSRNTLRKHLGWLELRGIIRLRTGREGSIAWLLNYDDVPKKQPVKSEKLLTHRSQQRCSNSAHPIRKNNTKYYNSTDVVYANKGTGSLLRIPSVEETGRYLASLSQKASGPIPDGARALINQFKSELR